MKKGKIVIILLIIILIAFTIMILRNLLIFINLYKKLSHYKNQDNYYIHSIYYQGESTTEFLNYKKDNTNLLITYINTHEFNATIKDYKKNDVITEYITHRTNDNLTKQVRMNSELDMSLKVIDYLDNLTFSEKCKNAILFWIKSEKYNGKEVYRLSSKNFKNILEYNQGVEEFLVDKETGLVIYIDMGVREKQNQYGEIEYSNDFVEYNYVFEKVTDEDMIEPEISEYEVIE